MAIYFAPVETLKQSTRKKISTIPNKYLPHALASSFRLFSEFMSASATKRARHRNGPSLSQSETYDVSDN